MGCVSTIVSGSPEDLSISHAQITGQTHFPTPLTFLKAATSSGTISFCSRAFIQTMQTVQSIAQSLPFDPCEFLVFPWMPQCLLAVPFLLQPVVSLSRTLLSQYLWWHTDLDFCVGHVNAFFFIPLDSVSVELFPTGRTPEQLTLWLRTTATIPSPNSSESRLKFPMCKWQQLWSYWNLWH